MNGLENVTVALAATLSDRHGRCQPGLKRVAGTLRELFDVIAVNATTVTSSGLLDALREELGATVTLHPPGDRIGWARKESVLSARELGGQLVLYSDFDHMLRWAEAAPEEIRQALVTGGKHDLTVIGRSSAAFAASPARLRETERLVNHVYELITGRAWDLMFAVRVLSTTAVSLLADQCDETTLANDVVWPLLAEQHGLRLAYVAAGGLSYRTSQDFDTPADERDGDPLGWIDRLELAALHGAAMRPFAVAAERGARDAVSGLTDRPPTR